jgi:pullulanase
VSTTSPSPSPDPDDHLDLRWRRAHLVTAQLLTWPHPAATLAGSRSCLHVACDGGMRLEDGCVAGADVEVALLALPSGPPAELTARDGYRHLAGRPAYQLDVEVADEWLGGQLVVTTADARGRLVAATGVQIALAIDERYATNQPLGVRWDERGRPTCALWAPTARSVHLHLAPVRTSHAHGDHHPADHEPDDHEPADHEPVDHDRAEPEPDDHVLSLTRGAEGVWSIQGGEDWAGRAYRYAVEVYDPDADRVVCHVVTDPWSVALTADSQRSLLFDLADLGDPALAPPGWASGTDKPASQGQGRMVVYELHLRDFSAADDSVPPELRGTYRALTLPGSHGTRHLRALAEAGVSHLHLLPINDLASIPETRAAQITPDIEAPGDPAASEPQAIQQASVDGQPYNWGYDPLHWLVPEGAYASDPDGPARIREVRELVTAVNRLGLRLVLDVVFNHTYRSGSHPTSLLDRIVPGYFHRLDDLGRITTSTCCPNTATEHAMMERLITDAVTTWARAYRVDGFRIDLLGHHPRAQARRLRTALDALTLSRDGVDGRAIVLYGEGWEFGEVAGDARFVQATQARLAGSGIGTFDDRLRDAVRGGNHAGPRSEQGFASGLWWEPNGRTNASPVSALHADRTTDPKHADDRPTRQLSADDQPTRQFSADDRPTRQLTDDHRLALDLTDRVRLGLAGSLAEVEVPCHDGVWRRGADLWYGDAPAGYTKRPQEQVAYVSAHDNETLFDALAAKLPVPTSMEDRVRMQVIALASVLLGQGTPFLHAGSELLRSKSLDRDSYRSGDWFNAIDWTASSTRWGVGLPPEASNPEERELLAELLRAIPAPEPHHIQTCRAHVLALLRLRRRSPLFGLPTASSVQEHLRFHLSGADSRPGQVVWSLHGEQRADHDLLLVLNASPVLLSAPRTALDLEPRHDRPVPVAEARHGRSGSMPDTSWDLHPCLVALRDPILERARFDDTGLHVPARTVAVFLHHRRPHTARSRDGRPRWDRSASGPQTDRERTPG